MSSKTCKSDYPKEFVSFLNSSHSPYHTVHNIKKHLVSNGFKELSERDSWAGHVAQKGKYFVTRNGSSIIAFAVGGKWEPGNPIAITGAHTDSPALRIKPISKRVSEKYLKEGVETYRGPIWQSC